MNADVADAVRALERAGTLPSEKARLFSRVARRELVSAHAELRLVAYAGVLLVTTGVGLLVRQNLERIGPLAIASVLALAVLGCFAWVARQAPPFTWGESASTHLAFDYILLLGALLTAALLAWVEAKFTPLGDAWPWHLLLVALLYGLLALRYDSRVVFSLALSTFAAWRGVSASRLHHALWTASPDLVRVNAAACGLLFLALGALLAARRRKAHFEPVATHLGWLLLLGAAASALGARAGSLWALVLLALAGVVAALGVRQRRFSLIAFGVLSGYVALSALLVLSDAAAGLLFWWFSLTPLGVVALLFVGHRMLQEPS
ncbi:MAG TPA: DUF2157 domain-containing protein [Vicinamibacteria bacterium]|nr:DUF2157 domain-containing protein [Vicinamibacteria bacterium]